MIDNSSRIMVIGAGDLGRRVFYDLAHSERQRRLHLLGRAEDVVVRAANLTKYSALQRGFRQEITWSLTDVENADQTAAEIALFRPDVIFLALSLQSWWVIFTLPRSAFDRLYSANFGPWLPMHLAPVLKAMRAVRSAGSKAVVVNAAYPDVVHPVLQTAGMSPHVGIGNVANNVPAIRVVAAELLGSDVGDVGVRLVAHHYASHRMSRFGDTGVAPISLQITRASADVTPELSIESLLKPLPASHRRTSGIAGQAMTAASALSVVEPLADNASVTAHAPGPNGLPGGYPVRIEAGEVFVDLPGPMSLDTAIDINIQGQVCDGITDISADGYVTFAESPMAIMRHELGYECEQMHWSEAETRAEELGHRFEEFRRRLGL